MRDSDQGAPAVEVREPSLDHTLAGLLARAGMLAVLGALALLGLRRLGR